jgi:outer membrane protein TolC
MLALALAGTDDPQFGTPPPASAPFTIEIKFSRPRSQSQAEQKVAAYGTPPPPAAAPPRDPCPFCSAEQVSSASATRPLPAAATPNVPTTDDAKEEWPMTSHQAIRIGLDNSELVRVIALGAQGIPIGGFDPTSSSQEGAVHGVPPTASAAPRRVDLKARPPIVVARLNADADAWRFKAEVMALVRSIEQQYWYLNQAYAAMRAAECAVNVAQKGHDRVQARLATGRSTKAEVAEASAGLERFKLDAMTRKSDVFTTERQLRKILDLPPADNRRIVPVTSPNQERVDFDWETSLREMLHNQPDVVQQKVGTRLAELQLLAARNPALSPLNLCALYQLNGPGSFCHGCEEVAIGSLHKALDPEVLKPKSSDLLLSSAVFCGEPDVTSDDEAILGSLQAGPMGRSVAADAEHAQSALLHSRAHLQQAIHERTHSLARFFLEVDADYKLFRTASRLRAAAADRLEAQRAHYEEGKIPIDRYFDAVSQHTQAIAGENQCLATYNIALAALSEAKGTLLADRDIVVALRPPRKPAWHPAKPPKDEHVNLGSFRVPAPIAWEPQSPEQPPNMAPPGATPVAPPAPDKAPARVGRQSGAAGAQAETKTWTFSILFGGAHPLTIKGTLSLEEPAPQPPADRPE